MGAELDSLKSDNAFASPGQSVVVGIVCDSLVVRCMSDTHDLDPIADTLPRCRAGLDNDCGTCSPCLMYLGLGDTLVAHIACYDLGDAVSFLRDHLRLCWLALVNDF